MQANETVLDLFCCSGMIAKGYVDAGLTVIGGVDIVPRPRYPFPFFQGDAIDFVRNNGPWIRRRVSLVHASPPCQANNTLTVGTNASRGWGGDHVDLVRPTRDALEWLGLPYIIEQPNGQAPIRKDITLCGEMFGLGVLRHRNFELGGWSTAKPEHLPHRGRVRGYRHGEWHDGPYVAAYGNGGGKATVPEMQEAMRVDWTDVREELTEGIPPAFGEWLGSAFLAQL